MDASLFPNDMNISKMKEYNNNQSPIQSENFIWVAEYKDGTALSEFDFKDVSGFGIMKHNFEDIQKDKLKHYGLIGNGFNFSYNAEDGSFNIFDSNIKIDYHDNINDTDYLLNDEKNSLYNDIIMYRTAEAKMSSTGIQENHLIEYGIGYKKFINGINLKSIFHIPLITRVGEEPKPTFFTFKLTSDKDIDGELRIYNDNKLVTIMKTDLKKNLGKEFKINVR